MTRLRGPAAFASLLIAATLSAVNCSSGRIAGGTEGGNTEVAVVTGSVRAPAGSSAAGARVRLRSAAYLAAPAGLTLSKGRASRVDAFTDGEGRFTLDSVDTGAYLIEVNQGSTLAVALACTVSGASATVDLPVDSLRPVALVSGVSPIVPGPGDSVFAQVRGLERVARVGTDGTFSFGDLPVGTYSLRFASTDASRPPVTVDTVHAIAGDSSTIGPFGAWKHWAQVVINTSPSGAGATGTVTGFPLLVTLDASSMDFGQAQDSGQDLRFARPDGTVLPCEIERWDRAAQSAAVWVLADTILGDRDGQVIVMYWGNPSASRPLSGLTVFDTALGFAGVWHMDSRGTQTFTDATPAGNHGVSHVSSPPAAGIAGMAQAFDGTGDYIDCGTGPNLAITEALTVSAWVKLAHVNVDRYHRIVSKKRVFGEPAGYEMVVNPDTVTGQDARPHLMLNGRDSSYASGQPRWDTAWHHCAVTWEAGVTRVYFDGEDVTIQPLWVKEILADPAAPLAIGGTVSNDFLQGSLDEVRVERVARSGAWVKTSFASQRPHQQAVAIRRGR